MTSPSCFVLKIFTAVTEYHEFKKNNDEVVIRNVSPL
jgi:hypothetical protein